MPLALLDVDGPDAHALYRNRFERPTSRRPGFPAILAVIR
jgi:hypothetical protein